MTFAEKLMNLRKSRGWSQEELGDKLGVTRQTISKWELGSTTPEMEKLAAISDLFGISTDELIRDIRSNAEAPEAPHTVIITETKKRFVNGEFKSKKIVGGVPLVHVNFKGKANGIIAVGLMAKGVISVGLLSVGVVSVGLLAVGILALGMFMAIGILSSGTFAVGVFACGGISVGVFSFGGISVGWLSYGGLAIGKYAVGGAAVGTIAIGGMADGVIAVGDSVKGEFTFTLPADPDQFKAIVQSRLPNTPKFIVDSFAKLAEFLSTE